MHNRQPTRTYCIAQGTIFNVLIPYKGKEFEKESIDRQVHDKQILLIQKHGLSFHVFLSSSIFSLALNYTTQNNLQIQRIPYQITNGTFCRSETKNLKSCMETEKIPKSQNNLEKENWELEESGSLISQYTIKLVKVVIKTVWY